MRKKAEVNNLKEMLSKGMNTKILAPKNNLLEVLRMNAKND